jgi:hypothetical protein
MAKASCAAAHECVKNSGERQCNSGGYFFNATPPAPSHLDGTSLLRNKSSYADESNAANDNACNASTGKRVLAQRE